MSAPGEAAPVGVEPPEPWWIVVFYDSRCTVAKARCLKIGVQAATAERALLAGVERFDDQLAKWGRPTGTLIVVAATP